MSQQEILDYLELEYVKDKDKWHSAVDIKNGLKDKGLCNGFTHRGYDDLYKLMVYNLVEYKGEGLFNHRKLFKAKKP
jgi:hypothetical protein